MDDSEPAEVSEPPPAARTVLVIDDNPAVHDLMRRVLRKEGSRVEVAADGATGLARTRELKPDVITLDLIMPGKDGGAAPHSNRFATRAPT